MSWDWTTLVDIRIQDGHVDVDIGPIVWMTVLAILVLWVIWQKPWKALRAPWKVTEISPTFFGTTWKIVRDDGTAQLAHEAYVELVTRKAGIPFDEDHDVIAEIYDSWHVLFGEIRRLTRQLSADDIARSSDLRRLHDLLIRVLNEGLRPHLTQWQAKYRRWYAAAVNAHPDDSPQDIQRRYPAYADCVASLREANAQLIQLANDLKLLAHGESKG